MNQASSNATCDITIPSNTKMDCTTKYYSVYKFLPMLNQFNVYSSQEGSSNELVLRDMDDSNAWNNRTTINNTHLSDGLHTIIIQNNVGTVKEGSTTLGSKNLIGTTKNLQLPANSNSNRKYSVKDIKIKPL